MSENANADGRTTQKWGHPPFPGSGIVIFAAILSVSFWIVDINVDLYVLGMEGTFLSHLMSPEPFEIYYRVLVVSLIMVLAIVGQAAISRARSSEFVVKQSEAWTRAILESVQTGIVVIDAESHKIVEANPVAVSMFGAPKSEIIGHVCHKFICPAEVGKCPVTDLGMTISNMEKCLIDSSGGCKPIMKSVTRASIGGRDLIIDSFVDISPIKKANEALAESERNFRTMMECSADAVFIADKSGRYMYTNPAATEMLGYSRDELATMAITDISRPEDIGRHAQEFKQLLQNGRLFMEIDLLRKDGSIVPTDLNATLMSDGRVFGSCRDVTARRNAELALNRANAGLEARVNQTNEISKALIGDIGIQRAAGIIYESGWKIGLAESRGLRAAWHGDAKSFAEGFFERRSTAVSFQVNLKEFDAERHYARARMFPVDCILDDERAADAEKAYAHGYVAAVLSVSLGKPVGLREGPKSSGNLAPSYEVETRSLEPYEVEAYRMV